MLSAQTWAANTKETVEQVTTPVTLTTDVDYIITSTTPFADEGLVNIENTEHAVLILQGLKPSKAKSLLASRIQINGQKAVDGTNCQLKMYNRGAIIMPYAKDLKPLTVYSEPNFQGESCNDFGLESTGGFMNTLSEEKLNNRIRSFKLKRGHMVTFSLKAEGRGYSRCFIAADEDLELANMPAILDQSISSYRVFRWYDAGKPQLAAAGGDTGACNALNVTSTYSWNAGTNMLPDVECVSHQIYSYYPSASACGAPQYTCHLKTSNEPRNSADDHPETLNDILNNWENLMRTGMRLCTPSSWDGSDYWNGTGFLKQFLDSIDARGWRCDVLDMHCYWAESNFGNLKNWVNAVHRPIWISEWCWGASWNTNGAFANGVTESQVRSALQRICNNLNGMDYVERYFYWNGERDPSRIYKNGQLTPAGQMYAQLDGGLAYNGKYDYVPRAPKQQDPTDLTVAFDRNTKTATLSWQEHNGEMNEYIHVDCRKTGSTTWETVAEVKGSEQTGLCTVSGIEAQLGWEFRIVEKDANGRERTTKIVMAASDNMQAGDAIEIEGETWYLGGNLMLNGSFEFGLNGWLNGQQESNVGQPWFQAIPMGGSNGGPYVQCYGNGTINSVEALRSPAIAIEPETNYYFSATVAGSDNSTSRLALSADGEALDSAVMRLMQSGEQWQSLFTTFNSGRFNSAILTLNRLGNKARFGNLMLCQLYKDKHAALSDAFLHEGKRAEMALDYLRTELRLALETALKASETNPDPATAEASYNELRKLTDDALKSQQLWPRLEQLAMQATKALDYQFQGREELAALAEETSMLLAIDGAVPSTDAIIKAYDKLKAAYDAYLPMTTLDDKVSSPSFATINGWQTKAGTYKEGEQQIGSDNGNRYWGALWQLPLEGNEQQTMAISQTIDNLDHGLYAVECLAATDHYCLSNQHAYISNGTDSVASPTLTHDFFDLPGMADSLRWQTLTSQPIYVADGSSITIGFEASKQGATDMAWREVGNDKSRGDHREGSWRATSFRLRFHPLFQPESTDEWGVACLPYAVTPTSGTTYYQIVALTSDYQKLCLSPLEQTEAGVPFIYHHPGGGKVMLPEYGEAVSKALEGPGNLRGYFKAVGRAPMGYYVLADGKWSKVTDSSNRPRMNYYTAIMRPLNDKQSEPFTMVDSWAGATMPIEGITDEEKTTGIDQLLPVEEESKTVYDMQGRRIEDLPMRKGLYIIIKNGKPIKNIIQ